MALKTKKTARKFDDFDIIFVFNNVKLFVLTDPEMYSEEETDKIDQLVKAFSQEIWIDKSYVNFPENKHQDVFLELIGWENLCRLVKKTEFGKKSTILVDDVIADAFKVMIIAYIYSILEKYDYDIDGIQLDVIANSGINTKFYKDIHMEWKRYPGPWQDWGLEDCEQK